MEETGERRLTSLKLSNPTPGLYPSNTDSCLLYILDKPGLCRNVGVNSKSFFKEKYHFTSYTVLDVTHNLREPF